MSSGVNRTRINVGYGLTNALQNLAQAPIVASRNPSGNDVAEYGTLWVNKLANSVFVNTGTVAGQGIWDGIANAPLVVNSVVPAVANQVGIYSGMGAPTFNAPKGSLYMRVDGSSTSTRAYVATNATGTWTNIVTAA